MMLVSIFAFMACHGCAATVADERPIAQKPSGAPIEVSDGGHISTSAPSTRVPSLEKLPVAPVSDTLTAHAPNRDLGLAERFGPSGKTRIDYNLNAPLSYEPVFKLGNERLSESLVSGFNEVEAPQTLLTGYRTDILATNGWSGALGLQTLRGQLGAQRLAYGTLGQERYDAQFSFSAPSQATGLAFDIGLVPSLSYAEEGDFQTRRIGAEVRLGQDIDQRGNDAGLPSWYFFAGADGEAIIFNNSSASGGLGLVNGLQLRDQVTVGDIQAGLNIRRYGTNFAFNYIRREVEYELNGDMLQRNEGFGGITLTWKR